MLGELAVTRAWLFGSVDDCQRPSLMAMPPFMCIEHLSLIAHSSAWSDQF